MVVLVTSVHGARGKVRGWGGVPYVVEYGHLCLW